MKAKHIFDTDNWQVIKFIVQLCTFCCILFDHMENIENYGHLAHMKNLCKDSIEKVGKSIEKKSDVWLGFEVRNCE